MGGKSESKAVAGAMRALQDKIKKLEMVNERMRKDFELVEVKLRNDREVWAEQSAREVGNTKSREATYLRHIQTLEADLKQERECNESAENMIRTLRDQSDSEKRDSDVRESSLQERIEMLMKQIDQKNKEIQLFERNLDSIEKERTRFLTENSDLNMKIARLTTELEFLKQGTEPSRTALIAKVQENESLLRQRLDESIAKSNDFEVMNTRLKEILSQKDRQLELLKIELQHESNQRSFLNESMAAVRASIEKPKSAKKTEKESPSKRPKRSKTKDSGAKSNRKESQPQPHPQRESPPKDKVQARVAQLEQEIQSQHEEYKKVLQQSETMDLSALRTSLNAISEDIEEKDKELKKLQKQLR